jgi:MOSC domain-containing protein YiiM
MGYLLHLALTQNHPVLPAPPPEQPVPDVPATLASAVTELDKSVARVNAKASTLDDAAWARRVTIGDETVDVAWIVGHAVHDASHHVRDVGRGLHALGAGAPQQRGTLLQVSASGGGVPKAALGSATVGRRGIDGDRQAERRHHGRPFQALCLWSGDVIDALRAEGHTVYAGAAGENLTLAGIDWRTIRTGVRVQIGEALAEISAFATPCSKNAQWFTDGSFRRIDHNLHPGSSRVYAWVLAGGKVAPGDSVVVEP